MRWSVIVLSLVANVGLAQGVVGFDGGKAKAEKGAGYVDVGNAVISARVSSGKTGLQLEVRDAAGRTGVRAITPFVVLMADGSVVRANEMRFVDGPMMEDAKINAEASRVAERIPGKIVRATLTDDRSGLRAEWRLELRDGSEYVRQIVTFEAPEHDEAIRRVRLMDAELADAKVVGTVAGSPIVSGDLFLGFEHPLSVSRVVRGEAIAELERTLPLVKGQSITYSA